MKRALIIILFLFTAAIASYSQLPYRPMLEEGKSWIYEKHVSELVGYADNWEEIYDEYISYPRYTIMGDTLINEVRYSRLMYCPEGRTPAYYSALREEGTAVYCIDNGKTEERILQDFGVEYPSIYKWNGDSIDYIQVRGSYYLRHIYDVKYDKIAVEGIGFQYKGILYGMYPMYAAGYNYDFFLRCELNGKTIFTNDDFHPKIVFPTAIQEVQTKKNAASPYYDLQGRRLQNKPGKGVYVSKGRKMVR